jgi:hypothetical protein
VDQARYVREACEAQETCTQDAAAAEAGVPMSAKVTNEIVERMRRALGETGLCHLAGIKARHGRIDAEWVIDVTDQKYYVNDHEGFTVREILRSFEECREWTAEDYMGNWLEVSNRAIEVQCFHATIKDGFCVECSREIIGRPV